MQLLIVECMSILFWANNDYLGASRHLTQNRSVLALPHKYNTILVEFGPVCLFFTPVEEARPL